MNTNLPVAVIGAGPVGLAAAAHLLERGQTPIVLEAGSSIGANVLDWGHVRMFSPWEYTVDQACVRLLEAHGWHMPQADALPTGHDLVERYLRPLSELPELREHLHLNARVIAVTRRDVDKMKDAGREEAAFVLHVIYTDGQVAAREALIEASAVIDASGTWQRPNPLGAGGLPAMGEKQHTAYIHYGIPDVLGKQRSHYAGQRVMVVGSGHSAINALLDLAQLRRESPALQIFWAMRGTHLQRVFGGGEDDALPARGQLGSRIQALVAEGAVQIASPYRVRQIASAAQGIQVIGETPDGLRTIEVDRLIAATGARPDLEMLRELRLDLDPALESARVLGPMIDPNIHSCGTVRPHGEAELRHPEQNFYIVGMKSYGRAPTFLLATGYEQVRSVAAALSGDWEAARDVQLHLPETGVCSTDLAADGSACCSPVSRQPVILSLSAIPVGGSTASALQSVSTGLIPASMAAVAADSPARACGCEPDCCIDGLPTAQPSLCGCEPGCCL